MCNVNFRCVYKFCDVRAGVVKFRYCSRCSLSLSFTLLPLLTKNVFHLDLYCLIMYGPKNGRATIRPPPVSDESRVLDTVTEASNPRARAQAVDAVMNAGICFLITY